MIKEKKMSKFSHISASQITMFSDSCARKWYEVYVNGEQLPSSKAQERGQQVHSHLENYILHGTLPPLDTEEGKIATTGLEYLPRFQKDRVFVEQSLDVFPQLNPHIKFKGFIDCLVIHDDYIEILDHKTTSNKKYMLSEYDLLTNTQLIIYAKHVMGRYPHTKFKLSHIYYVTTAPYKAEKRSVEVDRVHIQKTFDSLLPKIEEMVAAYNKPIDQMAKNESSCFSYGQRCPFYLRCKRENLDTLNDLLQVPTEETKTPEAQPQTTNPSLLKYLLGETKTPSPIMENKPMQEVNDQINAQINEPRILFVSCMVTKGQQPVLAIDALKPLIQEICTKERVPHISVIQYARGYDMLSTALTQQGRLPCSMSIDARSFEYQKIGATLESLADIVVRGV